MSTKITRGTTVLFVATFTDVNGVNATPGSASLILSFLNKGNANSVTIPMTLSGSVFQAEWVADSPDNGPVYWHVASGDAFPAAADGRFVVMANDANPQAN